MGKWWKPRDKRSRFAHGRSVVPTLRLAGKILVRKGWELHSPTQQLPLRSLSAVCLTHDCPCGAAQWPTVKDISPAVNVTVYECDVRHCREGAVTNTVTCV